MIMLPCKILRIRTRRSQMVKALEIPQLDKLAWVVLISLSIIISPFSLGRLDLSLHNNLSIALYKSSA